MKILDRGIHTFVKPGDPDGKGGTWSSGDFPSGIPPLVRVTDPNGIPDQRAGVVRPEGKPSNGKPYWIEYEVYEEVSSRHSDSNGYKNGLAQTAAIAPRATGRQGVPSAGDTVRLLPAVTLPQG